MQFVKKTSLFLLVLVVFLFIGKWGFAEPSESRRLAAIPPLPKTLPRLLLPGKSVPAWKLKPLGANSISLTEGMRFKNWSQGIYNWLSGQQNPLTGLVASFDGSIDPFLRHQAATYDQALAGMSFLLMGDFDRARTILDFYKSKWNKKGFYNFYSTQNGRVGLEWRRHVGPNMWLALFIYQYGHFTGDHSYQYLAEGLCDWVGSLPHYNGGPAMSDENEAEISWREIVSTENVIDALAVFQIAAIKTEDHRKKMWYQRKADDYKRFLKTTAIRSDGKIIRGYRPFLGGADNTPALDTFTWFVATMLPENIEKEFGVSVPELFDVAESQFRMNLKNGFAYDFTSKHEAHKALRGRICSIEWSCEMASAYWIIGHNGPYSDKSKKVYRGRADKIVTSIDQLADYRNGKVSYPYATGSFQLTFSDGWHTPNKRSDGSLPGSVAGTCWRLFATAWNPLRIDQVAPVPKYSVQKIQYIAANKKEKKISRFLPSSQTSEGLTTAAWLNLKKGNKVKAKEYALKCIHLYSQKAKEQQAKKAAEGGLIITNRINNQIKQRIFQYYALNDVAASWYILSKVDSSLNKQASKMIHQHYALAQVWDPKGKFWTVAQIFPQK